MEPKPIPLHYHIFDFKSVIKHTYFGCRDPESIHCMKTDRKFPNWYAAASDLVTRYLRLVFEIGDSPRDIIVAHDMGREFRTLVYPDYKGQKAKKDENKSPVEVEQLQLFEAWAKEFFRYLGVTQIGVKGVEADDVIAWIVQSVEAANGAATIYSVDFDLGVLVSDRTTLHTRECVFYGAEGVFETPAGSNDLEGIPFKLTSFAKSIMGDSSDNYKGVPGRGPAAVRKLIESFGVDGCEELIQIVDSGDTTVLDEVIQDTGDKTLKKLRENFESWRLGWKLAQLRPELCWKPRKRKLTKPIIDKRIPNAQKLFDLLVKAGCEDMWEGEGLSSIPPNTLLIDASNWGEMRDALLAEIEAGSLVSFDYETSDKQPIMAFRKAASRGNGFVDALSQELTGASFQFGKHLENVVYIPVDHRDSMNLNRDVLAEILQFCVDKGKQLVAHNAFFEGVVTRTNLGIGLASVWDTRIMQRFYDENSEAGLKFMSLNYLHYAQKSYEETLAGGSVREGGAAMMCELTADETLSYGADDAMVTGYLCDLMRMLLVLDGQWLFYTQAAVRPTEVLQRSYIDGVSMNWALQRRKHAQDLQAIEEGMTDLRRLLKENVTGNITEGAKSLIEAEKDYVYRSALKKTDSKDEAGIKLSEWRKKVETACQYTPYRQEEVMPKFAFTEKQVSAAALAVGLPEVEKLTQRGWNEYAEKIGAVGFRDEWTLTKDQLEFFDVVSQALAAGVHKMGDLRKAAESESAEDNLAEQEEALAKAEAAKEHCGEVIQRLAKVQPNIVSSGDELNVGSPQQMQHLLYCKIGAPVRLRGKISKNRLSIGVREAGPSTDEKAIQWALANDIKEGSWQAEALHALFKVKSATTRCSLYHDKYPLWRHRDGKIHHYITDYGTDTGRPTGSAPNVLQVSKKDMEMRSMYIPPSRDYVCVAIDYNGQEIRLMANFTKDPVLMSVYDPDDEKDLHSMTGAGVAKMSYEQFKEILEDKDHPQNKQIKFIRNKQAKPLNFGIAYGAGAGTLSRNMIQPVETARELLSSTMNLYTGIPVWQERSGKFMEAHGYTLTAYGCKRHATPDLFSNDEGKIARQKRQGTNFEIQGTAADMLRIALTSVAASGMMDRLRMVFFAPIYDEVVAWVHKDDVYDYCHEMGKYLAGATPPDHEVRQIPEFSIGPDWGRVEELGRDISRENVDKYVQMAIENAADIWEHDVLQPFEPLSKYVTVEADEDEDAELAEPAFD